MIKAFLTPQVFSELYARFKHKKLPIDLLSKILIREYGVEPNISSRVSKYFIDGLKSFDLIDSSNQVNGELEFDDDKVKTIENEASVANDVKSEINQTHSNQNPTFQSSGRTEDKLDYSTYTVHMYGPGLDTKIQINEEDDILIVEATLKKIKRKFKEMEGNFNNSGASI
jgi:hypothetical protein